MSKSQSIELPEVLAAKTSVGRFDARGREVLDPTPLEIAISTSVGSSVADMVQQLVAKALREHLGSGAQYDDENDFSEEEDLSDMSQYSIALQDRAIAEALQAQMRPDEGDVEFDPLNPPEPPSPRAASPKIKPAAPLAADPAAGAAEK